MRKRLGGWVKTRLPSPKSEKQDVVPIWHKIFRPLDACGREAGMILNGILHWIYRRKYGNEK